MRMPHQGDVIGERYYVSHLIGQGGFCSVYEASDMRTSGAIALKVLRPDAGGGDPQIADRFRQEVQLCRQLEHPNTIKIWDLGTTASGALFMVQEFLSGSTLDDILRETGPFPEHRVIRILDQVLRSLAEAHRKGIVHRDMKPGNIMLVQQAGETDFVKVLDFGIAKAVSPDASQVKTQTGFVICTSSYASPEALTGRGVKPATDIYAVGLIALELLTGYKMVTGGSDAEIVAKQISPEPVAIPAGLSLTPLGKVLARATAKSPARRYPDAAAMLSDLHRIGPSTTPQPLPATPSPTPYLEVEQDSEPTRPIMVLDGPGMVVGGGATLPRAGTGSAQTTVIHMPKKSGGGGKAALVVILLLLVVGACIAAVFLLGRDDQQVIAEADMSAAEDRPDIQNTVPDQAIALTQPDTTQEPPGPSAAELLETRLAAAEWDTGSWLAQADPVEPNNAGNNGQTRPNPSNSRPQVASIDDLIAEDDTEAARLALLYESAEANQQALTLIGSAFDEGGFSEADRETAVTELIRLTRQFVGVLLELNRCSAAERRLRDAVASARAWGVGGLVSSALDVIESDLTVCQERAALAAAQWDPNSYLGAVDRASLLCDRADELTTEPEAARGLRYRCIHERQSAIALLETALTQGSIPEAQVPQARRDLSLLNQEVLATLLQLELTVVAQVEIEETLSDPHNLSSEDREALNSIQQELAAEKGPDTPSEGVDWSEISSLGDRGSSLLEDAKTMVEPTEPVVVTYSARVVIRSEPRGANVMLGRRTLGRTPFDDIVEATSETIVLTIRKNAFDDERVRISLVNGDVRERVTLEASHPFGSTGLIE